MNKLLSVIKKLLLTFNWLIFGGIIVGLIIHAYNLDDKSEQTNSVPEWLEPIMSILSIFSDNQTFNIVMLFAFCVFIVGYVIHMVIQWIFD